jgi:hypothetical protein
VQVNADFGSTVFWKASNNIELFPLSSVNLDGTFTLEMVNRNKEPIHLNGMDYRIGILVSYIE